MTQLHLFGDAADPAERSAPTAGIGEAANLAAWIESTNTSEAGRSWQWRQVAEIEFGEKDA